MGRYPEALDQLKKGLEISKALKDAALEAKIQKAIGYVQWRKGAFLEAKEASTTARLLAEKTSQDKLQVGAIHDLAIIHWRLGENSQAKILAKETLERSKRLGYRRGESLSQSILGNIALSSNAYFEAKAHYQQMYELEASMGDLRGQGMSQGNLGIIAELEGDYSSAVNIFRDVRDVFHQMGDKASEARAWAHIGLNYSLQGVYDLGKNNYSKAVEIYREIDNKQGLSWALSMLGYLCLDTQNYDEAFQYCLESLELAEAAGSKSGNELANWLIGRISLAQRDLDRAEEYFHKAEDSGDQSNEIDQCNNLLLASQAELATAKGDSRKAQSIIDKIIGEGFALPNEKDNRDRVEILLTCYKVLSANQDPRAEEALEKAHRLITEQAEKISDENMRKSYLENVEANREVLQACLGQA